MTDSALSSFGLSFEPRLRPARLPLAEAQRLFETEHVPRTRRVLQRGTPWTLAGRHVIGTCYNFIRDQHLHEACGGTKPDHFFCKVFDLPGDLHNVLWKAGEVAAGLEYDWAAAARRKVPVATALAIVQGDPRLPAPIRQLLLELTQEPLAGRSLHVSTTMQRVCDSLPGHLRAWPEPTAPKREVLVSWIEEILAGPSWKDRRSVPREVEAAGNPELRGLIAAMGRRLDRLEAERAESRPPGGDDPRNPQNQDRGFKGFWGSAASAPGQPGPASSPPDDSAPQDPQDRTWGFQGSQGSPPQTPPVPEPEEQDERPPRVRAPSLLSEHDVALPVGHPGFPVSPFEVQTCEIIVASAELCRLVRLLMKGRWEPGAAISFLLQLRTERACERFCQHAQAARQLLGTAPELGKSCLLSGAGPGQPLRLPVHTDFLSDYPKDFHPISWVVVPERDPLEDPCPERLEPACWRVLGALQALHQRLPSWLQQRQGPQEFKKTQEQVGALGGVSYRDEVRGQIVDLRPSYVDPGGETLAAV